MAVKRKTLRKRNVQSKKRSYKKRSHKQRGGNNLATVGKPIGSEPSTWPGASGPHDGNHYPLNNNSHISLTKVGGRRKLRKSKRKNSSKKNKKSRRHRRRGQKGGSTIFRTFFPETTLVGENIGHSVGSAYNTFKGFPAPVDPKPWVQPELLKVQHRMI
tara:strand:+ start:422 stop:898 length:477 start_codon:yes stop_codon:yes gene_type:complete